jgi:AraC family transcriptional regulator
MQRTLSVEPLESKVVAQLMTSGAQIEVLHTLFPAPLDITVVESSPVLEFCLRPVAPGTCVYFGADRGGGGFGRLGPIFFKAASVPLRVVCPLGNSRALRCVLPRKLSMDLELPDIDWHATELSAALDIDEPDIRAALVELANEVMNPGFASRTFIDGCLNLIMVKLARYLHGKRTRVVVANGGLSPHQLRRVRERIASGGCAPTVSELAELAGVSNRHLMRAFKQSTGRTIGTYVEEVQLERAKQLLLQTDLSIKAIANQLGFSHTQNFSTAFHRATRQSPKVFRQEHRGRESI